MTINLEQLKQILELVRTHELAELEVEELDDCVALRVRLPEFGNTPIDALGSIIRKHKKGERSEIAVKFLWIGCEEKLQKTLKDFVQKKIQS